MRWLQKLIICLFITLSLSSCSKKPSNSLQIDNQIELAQSQVLINDILKGSKILALANQNTLYLVDPDFAKPVKLYEFLPGESPVKGNYNNFKVSPGKNYVLWYTPQKGLISLNIETLTTSLLEPSSDFFNTYPYFEFIPSQEIVSYIISDGNSLKQTDLNTGQGSSVSIPYPYGNVFKLSPDKSFVLFVGGYGQNTNSPQFMYSNVDGSTSQQFKAEINVFNRNHVFWAPDSSGTILINQNSLDLYPILNPQQKKTILTLEDEVDIESASILDNKIFIYDSKTYWHVFDYYSGKEIARTPVTIAKELSSPHFIPWTQKTFLIEEKLKDGNLEFNRLWVSDFRGNKKIVFERYNEIEIKNVDQTL